MSLLNIVYYKIPKNKRFDPQLGPFQCLKITIIKLTIVTHNNQSNSPFMTAEQNIKIAVLAWYRILFSESLLFM